ncbi:MAG: dynamin family protein [Deltaproteobacteria bacterium]|nr:dynamin family protein [Deltaproteobacteria bacterium]
MLDTINHGSKSRIQDVSQKSLKNVLDSCTRFSILSLNRQSEACQKLLIQNPFIDVAILGQFKAGKSSFINSLIGKSILPIGVIPVTTVITRLHYGEKERAVVKFFDAKVCEIDISEIDSYTSEAKNPSNEKNVEMVDIELPSLKDYDGLRLVDTPGLGSVFKYHRETSENWLPQVGTAILAISSDRPLSDNDVQLIRELTQYTPNIVILLTKADLLSPEQQTEVIKFFEQTLQRELNRLLPIYIYSTRVNTEQYKDRVEKGILLTLSSNRDFEFKKILQHKMHSLMKGCLGYLEIALKTSLQTDVDREVLRKQILDEKVNFDLIREELTIIARENQRQTRVLIMDYLDHFQKPLRKKISEELENELSTWKGNLWKLTRRYEEWLAEHMTEEMRHISKTEHKHFYGTLRKSHVSLSRSIESFRNLLDKNIEKVLGVKLAEADWKMEVSEPDHPDIKTIRSFDFHFDLIWFLIPMFIFRGLFEKHFIREIPREVEANLSRLASQWEDRINRAIEEMRKQAINYVKEELSTIDALLSKTHGQTDEINETMKKLHDGLQGLMV